MFYNKFKELFSKLISGGFGLAITFWIFGVLVAATLDLLIKNTTALWQLNVVTLIVIIYLVLITIAVWNAAKAYTGARIWSWGAKLVVIAGVAKWLWFLPDLVVTFLAAFGMPIHSRDYWDMNPRKLTCMPALYQSTPESIQRRYEGCVYTESANGEVINLRCRAADINAEHFYTRNLADCNKYIEKLRAAKNK
jgi:hypothetical protein